MTIYRYFLMILLGIFFNFNLYAVDDFANNKYAKHPEFERFQVLEKEGKSDEAKLLKIKIIKDITNLILRDYIQDFPNDYQKKMEIKINAFPEVLRVVLMDYYDQGKKLLNNPSKKDLASFVYTLYQFADAIDKGKMTAEKIAHELEKKFPLLKNTEYMEQILETGRIFDSIANSQRKIDESQRKIDEWNKIIEKLKILSKY